MRYKECVIGLDQSYSRTGISVAVDGELVLIDSVDLSKLETKTQKRKAVTKRLRKLLTTASKTANRTYVVCERVRMFSHGNISQSYIMSTGALIGSIVDEAQAHGVSVYSVDTKSWKSRVLGTSKGEENDFGVPPEKYPCIKWLVDLGHRKSILKLVTGRKKKGTFVDSDGLRYEYDNDAADSAGIAMYWWKGDHALLNLEE